MATKLVLVSLLLLQVTTIAFGKGHHPPGVGHHKGRKARVARRPPAVQTPISQEPGGPAGGIPAGGPAGGNAPPAPWASSAAGGVEVAGKKWCVAKQPRVTAPLITDFQRLCKLIDCSPTAPGGLCYDESHKSKATFAMNAYYQQNGQKDSDCDYEGRAQIITTDPSWGTCKLIAN